MINRNLTLAILIGKKGKNSDFQESSITIRYYKLCFETKIKDFSNDDVRFLISQNESLHILIPEAISILEEDFFIECLYYNGDLLKTVLNSDRRFWLKNAKLKELLMDLFTKNQLLLADLDVTDKIRNDIITSFNEFAFS